MMSVCIAHRSEPYVHFLPNLTMYHWSLEVTKRDEHSAAFHSTGAAGTAGTARGTLGYTIGGLKQERE